MIRRRWLAVALSFILAMSLTPVTAQTQNQAGMIIQYADGRVDTYCVRFEEPSISGLDLLTRAALAINGEFTGQGAAVCSINGEGCAYPTQPCFCQCQGADCAYWNYFHLLEGAWRYSPVAASAYQIENGAIEAWVWGDQLAPPQYTLDQICSATPTVAAPEPIAATATRVPGVEPTEEPTTRAAALATSTVQPTSTFALPAATREVLSITLEPTPVTQTISAASDTADMGSYIIVGAIVIILGGWLALSRFRK